MEFPVGALPPEEQELPSGNSSPCGGAKHGMCKGSNAALTPRVRSGFTPEGHRAHCGGNPVGKPSCEGAVNTDSMARADCPCTRTDTVGQVIWMK